MLSDGFALVRLISCMYAEAHCELGTSINACWPVYSSLLTQVEYLTGECYSQASDAGHVRLHALQGMQLISLASHKQNACTMAQRCPETSFAPLMLEGLPWVVFGVLGGSRADFWAETSAHGPVNPDIQASCARSI